MDTFTGMDTITRTTDIIISFGSGVQTHGKVRAQFLGAKAEHRVSLINTSLNRLAVDFGSQFASSIADK